MLRCLLLAVTCCLVQAGDLSGPWRTVAIASSDRSLITPGGAMRLYDRYLQCDRDCDELLLSFYTLQNGHCQKIALVTEHVGKGVYRTQYEGDNHFWLVRKTPGHLVFDVDHVDAEGRRATMVYVLGRGGVLSPEQHAELAAYAATKGIPPENIEEVIRSDVCPL